MKRFLAFVLIALTVTASIRVSFAEQCSARSFSLAADTNCMRQSKGNVTFTADTHGKGILRDCMLFDESGKALSSMNDDGKNGDKRANDGIYSCTVSLSESSLCTKKYYAKAGNIASYPVSVKFGRDVTESDLGAANALWERIERYEKSLAENGKTPEEIMRTVYLLVYNDENIYSITKNSEKSFSILLKSGIECYFEHIPDINESTVVPTRDLSFIQSGKIGVWCPFFGIDNDFTQSYLDRANAMKDAAGYDGVDAYYGTDANLESFRHFDEYGIIMIDCHGADHNGGGYIILPNVTDYDPDDVADGLVVLSGKHALISGAYIAKYNDTLQNCVIYTGICHGMQADNFYAPLLNHGAAFIAGFDESVSFKFDGIIMNDFCQRLAEINPSTGMQYTAGAAFDACVDENGSVDLFAKPRAHFVYAGNGEVVCAPVEIAVESVSAEQTEITLYHNNTYSPLVQIMPENANRYVRDWSTDRPDIVSVDEKGKITAGTTDGSAHVTCLVTDTAGGEERTFTLEMLVTVDGEMPVCSVTARAQALVFLGEVASVGGYVLPANASEQGLVYLSFEEAIAQVTDDGTILPVSEGDTFIETRDLSGRFCALTAVHVREGEFSSALNVTGADLVFTAEGSNESCYPTLANEDGRVCILTNNAGQNNSASTVTFNAGQLKKGDVIAFDRKVSCEAIYDSFRFTANGETIDEISGEKPWTRFRYTVKEDGKYVFKWIYQKDYSTNEGRDCAWLDNVDLIRKDVQHTVTFCDTDGSVLSVELVKHGEAAAAPERSLDRFCLYALWDTDFSEVRHDMTVTACDVLRGDANGDGKINTGDAVVILRICADMLSPDLMQTKTCDISADGTINTGDATMVLKVAAGMSVN